MDLAMNSRPRPFYHTSSQTISDEQRTPGDGSPVPQGQFSDKMPDAVLNTMLKTQGSGTPKPFAYITGGIDLKEFKQKKSRPPPPVMPKSYRGPDLNSSEPCNYQSQPSPPVRSQQFQPQYQQAPVPALQYSNNQPNHQHQQRSPGAYRHAQYNSPIQMYSHNNAEDALRTQSGGALTGISGYPEKPQQDIQQSEVYKMVQEADGQGKPAIQMPLKSSNGQAFSPEVASPSADVEHPRFLKSKKTGLSFRVLQWLTETDDLDDDEIVMEDIDSRKPKQPRDPLLRHNSIDDEMRFSGLNKKTDIPSKAFMKLNQISINDSQNSSDFPQSKQENQDENERVGNYEQTSIRYTGKHIPSPSFRVLQRFADEAQEYAAPSQSTSSPSFQQQQIQAQPRITIITRSHAVPTQIQPPDDVPSTDF